MDIQNHIYFKTIIIIYVVVTAVITSPVFAATELTLQEAETIALNNDPVIGRYQAQYIALSERAVAVGQLPDPELSFGIAEVPLNNLDLGDHEDTEVRLGLSQAFPPGHTLKFRSERMTSMANIEQARMLNQHLLVLNEVRNAYVELYYQQEVIRILELNRDLFSEMADITENQYAEGRDNQHDVLRAQLELSLIEDRLEETLGSINMARAVLSKWIQQSEASRPLPQDVPDLPPLATSNTIIEHLQNHPLLAAEDAEIEVAQKSVAIAEQQYKPRWMLDFMVSENTGSAFDIQTGPDFAGIFIKVSLPLFPDKRQDKQLSASRNEAIAARYNRADRLRELIRQVEVEYANLNRLDRRLQLYQQRATVEAIQTQEAAFDAYQNDLADFETLVRTRVLALDTKLEMLNIRTGYMKSHVNLLYLAGEPL